MINHQGNTNQNHRVIYLIPTKMATTEKNKRQQVLLRNGELLIYIVRMQNGAVAMESGIKILQKIKKRTSIRFSNPTSGYLSKRIKIRSQADISTLMSLQSYSL